MRTWIAVRVAIALVLGLVAGAAWAALADTAEWTRTATGLQMTGEQATGEFSAVGWFVIIGVVVGGMWGASFGAASRGSHPTSLFIVMGLSVVAALVAWQTGMLLGPPDPAGVSGLEPGDTVDGRLELTTWVPFLAWPFGVTLGMFSSTLFVPGPSAPDAGRHSSRQEREATGEAPPTT